jgi:galactoside O-acetyltransferase/dTDP-4-amino-4,6-dideoxygalactose transaminase
LTNPTIPDKYKKELKKEVVIKKHTIVGAGSIIMPGVILEEGTSVGALSLVRKKTEEWSVYLGNPAKKIKNRKKDLLELEKLYLQKEGKL